MVKSKGKFFVDFQDKIPEKPPTENLQYIGDPDCTITISNIKFTDFDRIYNALISLGISMKININ